MGGCFSKPKVSPSDPTPVSETIQSPQPSQPTSKPDVTTSTPLPTPGKGMGARVRALSQSAGLSQRRHHDGKDNPPPSSKPDGTTSTPSPGPGKEMKARTRAKSDAAGLSHRPRRDGKDYPPLSSGGDVFTLQHPDRREMPSRQNSSDETGRGPRTRSVSMDASLQSFSRRIRTASLVTGQITAGRGRSRFPFSLQTLLPNDFRYAVGRCPISP